MKARLAKFHAFFTTLVDVAFNSHSNTVQCHINNV